MLSWEKKLAGIDANQSEFPMCFGCGKENPVSLKLKFVKSGDEARCECVISELYQGWRGYVHGGIIFTILDEAMAYAYWPEIKGVTAKTEVRMRQPVPIGVPLVVTGRVVKKTRKLFTTAAEMTLRDGTLLAESTAQSYVVD
ncbi:MAG: PaaI family thioesterase [Chloroflexi bacterium]|nr:PaaI family thioesterase [Chloroflexota bacterium]